MFLTELVLDRIARLDAEATTLQQAAGKGSIVDNLADALTAIFTPVAVGIVALIVSRDRRRAVLRQPGTARIPVRGEATAIIMAYLAAEQQLGRLRADVDSATVATTLIGAAHLSATEHDRARHYAA